MANLVEQLTTEIKNRKLGNKSPSRQYLLKVQERGLEGSLAKITVDTIIHGINNSKPLTGTLRTIGGSFFNLVSDEDELEMPEEETQILMGGVTVDLMMKLGHIDKDMFSQADKDGLYSYFLVPTSDEFLEMVKSNKLPSLRANLGFVEWTKPLMHLDDRKIAIVKKAQQYKLLHNYRYTAMPDRYNTLNKLGRTEWVVNHKMLTTADVEASDSNVIPKAISPMQKRMAMVNLLEAKNKALEATEIKFLTLMSEGLDEKAAEAGSIREGKYVEDFNSKYPKVVISNWSKEKDFRDAIDYAKGYGDDILNFLYSLDSRGRCYVFNQHILNPQGPDIAKALLMLANPKPISNWDFKVCTANHAGQDKLSFEDRIKWFDDNAENILEVGRDTWGEASMEFLVSSGISKESKSKFQFIACCIEYVEYAESGFDENFLCKIDCALDATNSGLQILSSVGRDEKVAPYVNIIKTDKPGDIYQKIGNAVAPLEPVEKLTVIPVGDKTWRKICKRNVMTKNYDATRYGMGQQQFEDKPTKKEDSTGVWHTLTQKECHVLGGAVYDACSRELEKAHELMTAMKAAVSLNDKAVVSWKLPDGFLAFQAKPAMDPKKFVKVKLNGDSVQLVIYKPTDKANKREHSSAIAADVTHSIDAWLLSMIVNLMPEEANLSFVHDAFGSDSIHGQDIQEVAKIAYYTASSRVVMQGILTDIAGEPQELPEGGSWDPESLWEADYIVC